jgi:parallel beta-helix repeat protein
VQWAINLATTGDEILVATDVYTASVSPVAYINQTVTLKGGYDSTFDEATRNPSTHPTTLDARGQGRVIQITGNISPTIDGFIITGGNADTEALDAGRGGGIYSKFATPIIQNNVITDNIGSTSIDTLGYGGGLYLVYASASALISNNQILSNTASTSNLGWGGGLCLYSSDATLIGNAINNNTASTAASGYGGGLAVMLSEAALDGNRIINNMASSYGGGLFVYGGAPFTLTNNIIAQNEVDYQGGGIYVYGSNDFPASGAFINNTIAQNNLGSGGQGVYATDVTTLTLTNNIIVSHTYGIYVDGSATVTADYTLFFGNTSGDTWGPIASTHKVFGDPLFLNPSAWDYHIRRLSPAIDAGDPASSVPTTDFEGDPRPIDGDKDSAARFDIGADEFDLINDLYLPLILKNY